MEEAFAMHPAMRKAWIIALGIAEGMKYDWDSNEWTKPKGKQ